MPVSGQLFVQPPHRRSRRRRKRRDALALKLGLGFVFALLIGGAAAQIVLAHGRGRDYAESATWAAFYSRFASAPASPADAVAGAGICRIGDPGTLRFEELAEAPCDINDPRSLSLAALFTPVDAPCDLGESGALDFTSLAATAMTPPGDSADAGLAPGEPALPFDNDLARIAPSFGRYASLAGGNDPGAGGNPAPPDGGDGGPAGNDPSFPTTTPPGLPQGPDLPTSPVTFTSFDPPSSSGNGKGDPNGNERTDGSNGGGSSSGGGPNHDSALPVLAIAEPTGFAFLALATVFLFARRPRPRRYFARR